MRPERVSPWEIETFVAPVPASLAQPLAPKVKRPRPPMEIPNIGELSFQSFFHKDSVTQYVLYNM